MSSPRPAAPYVVPGRRESEALSRQSSQRKRQRRKKSSLLDPQLWNVNLIVRESEKERGREIDLGERKS